MWIVVSWDNTQFFGVFDSKSKAMAWALDHTQLCGSEFSVHELRK